MGAQNTEPQNLVSNKAGFLSKTQYPWVPGSDATELEIGELSRAGFYRAELSWPSFIGELNRAGAFKERADYELKFFCTQYLLHKFEVY